MMIKTTSFEPIINNSYGKQQIRLIFKYNDQTYNLPITDPLFLRQYKHDNTILNDSHKIYIILSLGVEFNSNFYKLVATIFYDL